MLRTRSRSARKGEINAVKQIKPAPAIKPDTTPARRMFSCRSVESKPKSQHKPARSKSPSMRKVRYPQSNKHRSTDTASVVFPAPLKPVNQTTKPDCPFLSARSATAHASIGTLRIRILGRCHSHCIFREFKGASQSTSQNCRLSELPLKQLAEVVKLWCAAQRAIDWRAAEAQAKALRNVRCSFQIPSRGACHGRFRARSSR